MRSQSYPIVSCSQVHQWALLWLMEAEILKNRGGRCSNHTVWNIVLRAAARLVSIYAACRDLSEAPSQTTVFKVLENSLPRTLSILEKRLNSALIDSLCRRLKRPRWEVAIDWHLVPYYGEPHRSRNEVYRSKQKNGTTHFHAYATVCIVQYGHRYTLALTWIRRHESTVKVLRRLLVRIRELGLKIRALLLDRAFFSVGVTDFLQEEEIPFLMPVMFRGRKPKKKTRKKETKKNLRWIKRQKAGRYRHTMNRSEGGTPIDVWVSYRTYLNRKTKRRGQQKLLFAAWKLQGSPTEIRERYRKRFGIESSFRQLRQARIYTCTQNPHLRLVFVAIALLLRNLWIWIHATILAERIGDQIRLRMNDLRFKQMLDWIAQAITTQLHDGSRPCVVAQNLS
jgi:Transposase DDE domain